MPSTLDPTLESIVAPRAPVSQSPAGTKIVVLCSLAWIGLASGAAYVMDQSRRSQDHLPAAVVAPALPEASVAREASVFYTNPFDSTEVFEFPAGTTEAAAHSAVAEFLLRRAKDRVSHREHLTRIAAVTAPKGPLPPPVR